MVRGVAIATAPVLGPPPDNDPEFPLSLLIATSAAQDQTPGIDALKKDGRKSALLLLANKDGDLRFVAVKIGE